MLRALWYRGTRVGWGAVACIVAIVAGPRSVADILVVQGRGDPRYYAGAVIRSLSTVGVECRLVRIDELPAEEIDPRDLIILPYSLDLRPYDTNDADVLLQSAEWSGPALDWMLDFVARDGKVIAFYLQPTPLLRALGFDEGEWIDGRAAECFATVRGRGRSHDAVVLREFVNVVPRAYVPRVPAGEHWCMARWHDVWGDRTGHPAVVTNDHGALIGAPPSQDDLLAKGLLLLNLIFRFRPLEANSAAQNCISEALTLPGFRPRHHTSVHICRELAARAAHYQGLDSIPPDRHAAALGQVREATLLRHEARLALADGDPTRALHLALRANRTFDKAYISLYDRGPPDEFRAVWTTVPRPAYGWDRVARELAASGIDCIIPYMSSAGVAFYPSEILPVADGVRAGNDYLGECVTAAHRHGLQVHVWRTAWNMTDGPAELLCELEEAGRLVVSQNGNARHWLCPSVPENREHELRAFVEIPELYDVDGVHLDYMRYPHYPPDSYCFCGNCRRTFERASGMTVQRWPGDVIDGELKDAYGQWRKDLLTSFVAELRAELRERHPQVSVSAALFGWPGARETVGQDAMRWIEDGYVDTPIFMNYTDDNPFYERLVRLECEALGPGRSFVTGVGAFSHAACFTSTAELVEQIAIGRRAGASGFAIFKLTHTLSRDLLPGAALGPRWR